MTAPAREGARSLLSPLARVKDAGLASLVALILATPLVGFETYDDGGTLALRTRWPWVGAAGGLMFLGRLTFRLIYDLTITRARGTGKTPTPLVDRRQQGQRTALIARALFWAALGLAVALPFLPFTSRYTVDIATTVLIYVMLGWGLNVVVGLAGLLDLGYVGFYAIGAYSYALLAIHFGLNFWQSLPFAGLFAAVAGVLLGFPVLRLRGDYLAIVTLGFGEMIRIVLTNWTELTGGPNGLTSLPRPSFFGLPFTRTPPEGAQSFSDFFGLDFSSEHRVIFLYFVILVLALATNGLVTRLRALPIGRSWEALREDEIACRSLGINPTNVKLSAFGLGAMLGGLAGAFFATRQGFISPESFSFTESAVVLAIVVLGGMGSQIGVVIAALFLVLLPELGREFAQYRMLIFGMAMISVMVWKPSGLLSRRVPTVARPVLRREGAA